MSTYLFRYRRAGKIFWKKKRVCGHNYNQHLDRMSLSLPNETVFEIPSWTEFEVKLCKDWVSFVKKNAEEETGQDIKLSTEE